MKTILDSSIYAALQFKLYRYRFILVYVSIGFASIWVEVLLMRGIHQLGGDLLVSQLIGLAAGIFFAAWMNLRFNFKVPVVKRNRALAFFVGISLVSASINFQLSQPLVTIGWSYEQTRFTISGALFLFGYLLHRQFSFVDQKQVGVAVYANGVEDIQSIWKKIGDFPDFIHVDLIDATFGAVGHPSTPHRLEAIRAYWPRRKIHVHLMTRHPLKWLPNVLPYVDLVIIHAEISEPIDEVLAQIRKAGRKTGLCMQMSTASEVARSYVSQINILMLLTISTPGCSGQNFQLDALDKIRDINSWPERQRFSLCVDGGVNEGSIHLLNVELVVSGSSVLKAPDSVRQIMRLQTSNSHEAI